MGAAFTLQMFYLSSALDGRLVEDPAPYRLPVSFDMDEIDFDWDDEEELDSSPGALVAAVG